jgi:hypothetical protein
MELPGHAAVRFLLEALVDDLATVERVVRVLAFSRAILAQHVSFY